jgi:hypothetical protein
MHWMRVKLPDNFQIREHSWPFLFHINKIKNSKKNIAITLSKSDIETAERGTIVTPNTNR